MVWIWCDGIVVVWFKNNIVVGWLLLRVMWCNTMVLGSVEVQVGWYCCKFDFVLQLFVAVGVINVLCSVLLVPVAWCFLEMLGETFAPPPPEGPQCQHDRQQNTQCCQCRSLGVDHYGLVLHQRVR